MTSSDVFVGVADVVSLRRDILNSSKNVITSLRAYEKYKGLRREKLRRILELCHVLAEINGLNNKLMAALPKVGFERPVESFVARVPLSAKEDRVFAPVETKSKIYLLEKELDAIESKLSSLS